MKQIIGPIWTLSKTEGPGYLEVVQKFPKRYALSLGDVYTKNSMGSPQRIAKHKFPGRPITSTSLEIEYDLEDIDKLTSSLELAKLLEEAGCSDFTETPSKKSLLRIFEARF